MCEKIVTSPNELVAATADSDTKSIIDRKVTSYGPSGIGFVNFGTINCLKVNEPIETFGQGARGFNVYTGTLDFTSSSRTFYKRLFAGTVHR
jgi:hypothetical protein